MSTRPDALFNLADAMAEDILNTPDDEVLREVKEDYGDPHALARKFDQILERAEKQARPRSSVLDLPYRLLEWSSTLFGAGPGRYSVVWASAAAVLIALILALVVFRELDKKSGQLEALEKRLDAWSERLAALDEERKGGVAVGVGAPPLLPPMTICENLTEPIELLICADADLAFWGNLMGEIYEHKLRQLDANGQQILHQGQLDWLGNMRVNCNVPETGTTWKNAADMERAKSCVLQWTKERVAVLSNN